MTQLGLSYLNYAETKRANLAREAENIRSNMAREAENLRSNLASEGLERQRISETATHNRETEQLARDELAERVRHQQQTEEQARIDTLFKYAYPELAKLVASAGLSEEVSTQVITLLSSVLSGDTTNSATGEALKQLIDTALYGKEKVQNQEIADQLRRDTAPTVYQQKLNSKLLTGPSLTDRALAAASTKVSGGGVSVREPITGKSFTLVPSYPKIIEDYDYGALSEAMRGHVPGWAKSDASDSVKNAWLIMTASALMNAGYSSDPDKLSKTIAHLLRRHEIADWEDPISQGPINTADSNSLIQKGKQLWQNLTT